MSSLSLFRRHSDGALGLIAYHPRKYPTWVWSLSITRRQKWLKRIWNPVSREWRKNQWHHYLKLPFGFQLCISQQDYHRKVTRS
jgi:hypothetical protein